MSDMAFDKKVAIFFQLTSICAILAVLFGFLIVNMWLALFGFWDFNFLKVQYISAGLLFLCIILIHVVFAYAFFKAKDILERYRIINSSFIKSCAVNILKFLIFCILIYFSFSSFRFLILIGNIVVPHSFLECDR